MRREGDCVGGGVMGSRIKVTREEKGSRKRKLRYGGWREGKRYEMRFKRRKSRREWMIQRRRSRKGKKDSGKETSKEEQEKEEDGKGIFV